MASSIHRHWLRPQIRGPFFHNNSVETIEGAVAFYNGDAFTNSPAGQLLINATGSAINLDATQVVAVAAFLRVINALENIRTSIELLERSIDDKSRSVQNSHALLEQTFHETDDALQVLKGGGLHPGAVANLEVALELIQKAISASKANHRNRFAKDAIVAHMKSSNNLSE